ncbi:hypothetical protein [Notoacmeibacter sp. MSK16QG-6]|uniref:hypothetical protein n=1 Tax=Notoacmeibacter sp. MSK16QG-6 TaxID=2957982 RepID=UPI00209F32FB|nr:hypothetical protein [Notoacmeibacter sp. MSK16QG-6]MCP1199981.1 hypothetical protein [Notoacmeibacter sp. MSK16QG-6]
MNTQLLRSEHATETQIEEAEFEIISPTAKSRSSIADGGGENKIGFAILLVALSATAFLVSGGWHVFRS